MEKGYKKVVFFFAIILMIALPGFYKSYFALFPEFAGLKNIHHFHATVLLAYLIMLVVQPILISRKKFAAHRFIGKVSYLLVPLIFVSLVLVYHNQYLRMVLDGKPESDTLAFVFAPTTDAIPFLIFYLIAVFNTKQTPIHMRFIIASAIVAAGPGFGRIFIYWFGVDVFAAIQIVTLVSLLTFVALIFYDKRKKLSFRINPYTIAFIIWLIPNILIIFFPNTTIWQGIAKWLVTTF